MLPDEVDETSVLVTRQSFALLASLLFSIKELVSSRLTFCSKFKTKAQLWLTAVQPETVEVSKPHCA